MSQPHTAYLDGKLTLHVGDLTRQAVDAIVNAANSSLMGGGGVDGAIHRAAGPALHDACADIRRTSYPEGLPTGEVVITPGGDLPARHVIHTVGPIYGRHGGKEAKLLAACYRNALSLARQHGLRTIAFPSISTGAYGYPPEEAAAVVSTTLRQELATPGGLEEVRLVFFDERQLNAFVEYQQFTK
jgi:O-acetyl-ADP-ribose deacetylase (regulator of RNase III)